MSGSTTTSISSPKPSLDPQEPPPMTSSTSTPTPLAPLSDAAFAQATSQLAGEDLTSIADLTPAQTAALMELAHAVKAHPEVLPPRP